MSNLVLMMHFKIYDWPKNVYHKNLKWDNWSHVVCTLYNEFKLAVIGFLSYKYYWQYSG